MNSRSKILAIIKENKPSLERNVDVSQFFVGASEQETIETFCKNLVINEGKYIVLDVESDLLGLLESQIEGKRFVDFSGLVHTKEGSIDPIEITMPRELARVKVVIVRGMFGVAENAAVWWEDKSVCNNRVLPFIVEHTIFIISKKSIVPTMHHAYQKLANVQTGFGSFIAGPSKTGDIEQTLVTGAHGALSHLVVLV